MTAAICCECRAEAVHEAGPKSPMVIRHAKGCSESPRTKAGRKGAAATNAKRAPGKRPKPEPRECVCGCGNITRGGSFLQGHDAKHKSELVRRGLQEEPAALAELEERGWTKFLIKAQEIAARPKADPVERQAARTESVVDSIDRYHGKRLAGAKLKEVGRYTRKAELGQLIISNDNYARIVDLPADVLRTITQEELDG